MTSLFGKKEVAPGTDVKENPYAPVAPVVEEKPVVPAKADYTDETKVVLSLIRNGFLFRQNSFVLTSTGEMVTSSQFTIKSAPKRGQDSKEIPIRYCPVTGVELNKISFKLDLG